MIPLTFTKVFAFLAKRFLKTVRFRLFRQGIFSGKSSKFPFAKVSADSTSSFGL